MREMKESGIEWLEDIPSHWKVMPNKRVMKKKKEICPQYQGEDILSLTMNGVIVRDLNAGGKMPATFDGYQRLTAGNLLMCLFDIDVTPRCIGLIKNAGLSSPAYSQFVVNEKGYAPYYYYYYLNLDHTKELLHMAKNLRHSLTEDQLGEIGVAVPPYAEQVQIVEALEKKLPKVDTLIANVQSQIEKLKAYKQSLITEVVTKGLDPNAPMKDSGVEWIGEIPAHWTLTRLKFICQAFGRIGFRGYTTDDFVPEGEGAITLSPSNFNDMKMNYNKCSYLSWDKYNESPEIQIHNGDVLFVKTGSTYGKSCVVHDLPCEATINPQSIVFKNIKMNVRLFGYFLNSIYAYWQVEQTVVGGTIPTIAQSKIINYFIVLPDEPTQSHLADYLDEKCEKINRLIDAKQAKIEKLEQYKKSLIYEYVTGKKEVC